MQGLQGLGQYFQTARPETDRAWQDVSTPADVFLRVRCGPCREASAVMTDIRLVFNLGSSLK